MVIMKMNYGDIKEIVWYYKNGMKRDRYTVIYENGRKDYTIKAKMIKKHYEFIRNAHCETHRQDANKFHEARKWDIYTTKIA